MARIERFDFPDENWTFWGGRKLRDHGLVWGYNPGCLAFGPQWWKGGWALHLGPVIIGCGRLERPTPPGEKER